MISKAKRVEVAVERLDVSAFVVPTDLCNPSETELTGRLPSQEAKIRTPNLRLMFDVTEFRASA